MRNTITINDVADNFEAFAMAVRVLHGGVAPTYDGIHAVDEPTAPAPWNPDPAVVYVGRVEEYRVEDIIHPTGDAEEGASLLKMMLMGSMLDR